MPEGRPPSCTQDRGVGLLEQGLDIDNDGGLGPESDKSRTGRGAAFTAGGLLKRLSKKCHISRPFVKWPTPEDDSRTIATMLFHSVICYSSFFLSGYVNTYTVS